MIAARLRSVRRTMLGVLTLLWCVLGSPSMAVAEPVTLDRVVTLARDAAPSVTVAKKRVTEAEAGFASANKLLRFNPKFQFGLATDAPFDNEGDRTLAFGLSQTVEIGGQQGLRRDIAGAEVATAAAEMRRTRNDVSSETVGTFFALDTARKQVSVEKQIAEIYKKLATSGRSLFERGAITRLDLATLEIETARVETQVERDNGAAAALESELGGLIGRPGMALEPVTPERPPIEILGADEVVARALGGRPELAGARARQRTATAAGMLIGRELWLSPTFSVGLRHERVVHGVGGFRFGPGGVPNLLGVDNPFWIASADISVPIPIFEQRNTERSKAAAAFDLATAEERAILVAVETEVRAAVARANAAARAFELQEKARATMEEMGPLYESAFARGATTVSDTLLGEERVLRARINYLMVRGEYLRARALVERAAGAWS